MKKFYAILSIVLGLGLMVVLAALFYKMYIQKESAVSCDMLPFGNEKLHWGMRQEEIKNVLGDPDSEETDDYGEILTYDSEINSNLGTCCRLVLYVGTDNLRDTGGNVLSGGLCSAVMTIKGTTKEKMIGELSQFYGEIFMSGGSVPMEQMLIKVNENYFNESYYCDIWKTDKLEETDYDLLADVYRESNEGRTIDKEESLVRINISGVEEGGEYDCTIQLNAYVLTCLKAVK